MSFWSTIYFLNDGLCSNAYKAKQEFWVIDSLVIKVSNLIAKNTSSEVQFVTLICSKLLVWLLL